MHRFFPKRFYFCASGFPCIVLFGVLVFVCGCFVFAGMHNYAKPIVLVKGCHEDGV